MKRYWFPLSLTLVVALTLVSGVVQGRIRNRWGPSETMLEAARKLQDVPGEFGNWRLESSEEMSDDSLEQLECAGYIVRQYVNQRTGERISMFLIVGPAGPIAVHTPEICYSTQNYRSRDPRREVAVQDSKKQDLGTFWAMSFHSKPPRNDLLRVYYAWSTGNEWTAARNARWAFVGHPYLYKLQLSSTLPPGTNLEKSDTCKRFLADFLPAAKPCLIAPVAQP